MATYQIQLIEFDIPLKHRETKDLLSQLVVKNVSEQHQHYQDNCGLDLSLTLAASGGDHQKDINPCLHFPEHRVIENHNREFPTLSSVKKRKRGTSGDKLGFMLLGKWISLKKKTKKKRTRPKVAPLVIAPTTNPENPDGRTVPFSDDDKYTIKKTLKKSDIEPAQNRLIVEIDAVKQCIKPFLNKEQDMCVEDSGGVIVTIKDIDHTPPSRHSLNFVRWPSTGSYVLQKNWMTTFVRRKKLQEGDEIRMRWIEDESQLAFWTI